MMPGMPGGPMMRGGGMQPSMGQPTSQPMMPGAFGSAITPQSGMFRSQQNIQSAMENLQRMQERCARGDGSACIGVQGLQQRLAQMQAEHQQQLGMQQMGAQMRGNNPAGGRGPNMGSYASAMLGAMYGMPGGGGGLGSSSMGGGGGW